jgi:hypothetical protein
VTKIAPGGAKRTVAADLPSLSLGGNGNAFILGPAGPVMAGSVLWVANGAMVNGHPPAPNAATLLRADPRTGAVPMGADVAALDRVIHQFAPAVRRGTSRECWRQRQSAR